VPGEYDPLLAKLIAWGADRREAISRLERALGETRVQGIRTNIEFFRRILAEPDFLEGRIHTKWLDDYLEEKKKPHAPGRGGMEEDVAVMAAALWHLSHNSSAKAVAVSTNGAAADSRWKTEGRREQIDRLPQRA
jgi:acetyl-CoA carboxylase, biotin carboxylase subunit